MKIKLLIFLIALFIFSFKINSFANASWSCTTYTIDGDSFPSGTYCTNQSSGSPGDQSWITCSGSDCDTSPTTPTNGCASVGGYCSDYVTGCSSGHSWSSDSCPTSGQSCCKPTTTTPGTTGAPAPGSSCGTTGGEYCVSGYGCPVGYTASLHICVGSQMCCGPSAPSATTDCTFDDDPATNVFPKPCNQYLSCSTTDKCTAGDYYACYGVCDPQPEVTQEPVDVPAFTNSCLRKDSNNHCIAVDTAIGEVDTDPAGFVTKMFSVVLGLGGGIALILIILSGYRYMSSQGNPEGVKAATEQLTSAVVGLLFIIFAFVILQVIGVDILKIPGFS